MRTVTAPSPRRQMLRRRLVSLPLALLGIAAGLPLLPLLLGLALVADLAWPARFGRTRTVLLLGLFIVAEALGLIGCLAVWAATAGGPRRERIRRNYALQRTHHVLVYRAVERIFSLRTVADGLDDVGSGPLVVLSRHAGYADTFLPWLLLGPCGLRPRFVIKRALTWLPTIDIVGHRLPHTFVGNDPTDVERVSALLDDADEHDAVIIYPEGGRFTAQRKAALARSTRPALASQAAALRHLLPPRLGGPLALLTHPRRPDVLLCAHAGLESLGSLPDLLAGAVVGRTVRVRFWRVAADTIPRDEEALAAWLFEQWQRMDAWLAEAS